MSGRETGDARVADRAAATSVTEGLGFRLGLAHRTMRSAWEERIADLEVSAPQAVALRAVCEWPGTGLRGLARRMRTDAMNAKRLADHLERAGLLTSVEDPEHRQRRVLRPTLEGRNLAVEVSRRARAWERRLAVIVGADELAALSAALGRLSASLASGAARQTPEDSAEPGDGARP